MASMFLITIAKRSKRSRFVDIAVALATFYGFYAIAIGTWRLYFHPLSKFPGPRLAALTLWYECYFDVFQGGQYFKEIERLHSIYGPIVRISPSEIHIKDPEWVTELYPLGNRKRNKYAWFLSEGTNATSSATVHHDVHRQRRSALAPSFSKQSVVSFEETVIRPNISTMCSQLDAFARNGNPVVLGTVFSSLTIDSVLQMWYGAPPAQTNSWSFFPRWTDVIQPLLTGSHFFRHFPKSFYFLILVPKSVLDKMEGLSFIFGLQKETSALAKVAMESDHSTKAPCLIQKLKSSPLPANERSLSRLSNEGFSFIMASTESTAQTLSAIFYHLADNPDVLAELRIQIRSLCKARECTAQELSWTVLEQLSYLRYIVMESMRVTSSVTGRLARIAPDETLKYKGWEIPPGTPVSMDHHFTHLDPTIFPEPKKFNPDRWKIASESGNSLDRYFLPFGRGSRMCIGMNLAKAIIYRTIATVVQNYDFDLFETTRDDVEIVRDNLIGAVKPDSQGVRVTLRQRMKT
ncbi:hypothetical protein LOZ61_003073 [Ophidiomyces ophidiicola]|uniref:Uncharacterized protein n=1 Tax=Ophidiomyces ophidiicola TaxID=1387563 RepID=A0ACB8V319_9EURO|nr:uncharacterized protein LOZ57_005246 [Ophidiomyces ophidiicola]KAI1912869.1 hypothetical protein LOZ61_003073 [Ophidiomyces ophidiicola]KAI1930740.1 hypothetical protein LOZ60_000716 [Ophidiomyces ophidiicola]KAI1942949.1 hypothetical protein LOZ57_005246 [Ophidiomyces ophidiicola]KAI1962249.1 hypothetical protein LOZ59_002079 [Ophidiomyces ophidiicola]KAI1976142.1 hypothetical protein LOZ56_000181 [Ophidiomyces ophidiicola]